MFTLRSGYAHAIAALSYGVLLMCLGILLLVPGWSAPRRGSFGGVQASLSRSLPMARSSWSLTYTVGFIQSHFFVQHLLGMGGMTRRVWTYPAVGHWAILNLIQALAHFCLLAPRCFYLPTSGGASIAAVRQGTILGKRGRLSGQPPHRRRCITSRRSRRFTDRVPYGICTTLTSKTGC